MEILNHPTLLFGAIVLSIVSSYFLWRGFKERSVPNLLLGVGTGIPPFDMQNLYLWALGAGITFLGYWIGQKMESI